MSESTQLLLNCLNSFKGGNSGLTETISVAPGENAVLGSG